ncbi:DDE-type integrase/transposase/recombinase [Roseibium marinum]|uniref:DDE-type integrase/transposase/recombinase n=1 Tax=Roseibium marinum TaxID=281252 RepID=UPI0038B63D4E
MVDRPDQVWCSDITFVPVRSGFLYLVAILDWATRKNVRWRLSNTTHAGFEAQPAASASSSKSMIYVAR